MKKVLFALQLLGWLTACQKEEQAVAPSSAQASARIGATVNNPWTDSGIPMPDVPLDRMMRWPLSAADSATFLLVLYNDVWHQEFGHKLTFPVKVYFNGVYKGQIKGFADGQITATTYPAGKAIMVRMPKSIPITNGVVDKNGYYYEMYKTHPSGQGNYVSLYNVSPNNYYWKLKFIPQ